MGSSFFTFFSPFINSFNAIRRPNPNRNYTQEDFTSCWNPDGLMGNCLPATVCKSYGGRPSGSCRIAAVCCMSKFQFSLFCWVKWRCLTILETRNINFCVIPSLPLFLYSFEFPNYILIFLKDLISKCGERMTLNNTEWKNPPAVSSNSPCNLTIALDRKLVEQRGPTCQVR
jgi:hypothetical protein